MKSSPDGSLPDPGSPRALGAAVAVAGLSKRYGSFPAVDSVDLTVRAGEFVSLLGPSGSGKTTLLMMMAGFEMPSAGSIQVGGRDFTFTPPNKRGIGMVFQRYALFPHMSVAENIGFPLKMRGDSKGSIAGKVERALALVRLEGFGGRMPGQLSGGQQQRVAVARAIVFEPPVLLMDEPLGALDKKLREELQIEIKKLHDDLGLTVIYVTHDQEEALTMSDRIAIMNGGRIEQLGAPRDLYDAPGNRFVADFIGKMNFIAATIGMLSDTTVGLKISDAELRLPREACAGFEPEAGRPIRLAVRPEQVRIAPSGADDGGAAVLGVIETSIFVGAHTTLIVRLGSGELIHSQITDELPAALYRAKTPVSVRFDKFRLFPGEG
jgi:spermidine/putrescine ABC transporter ATP-binding subunit